MISVIACTNRQEFVHLIIENFQKQTLAEKELILILNSLDLHAVPDEQMKILCFPEDMSLGECLNRGVKAAKYDYIAKMDDDDYYGADYLKEAYEMLVLTGADLVGKGTFYIYFKRNHEIRLYNPNYENKWIVNAGPYKSSYFLSGATLAWKKSIFNKVCFPKANLGEDSGFQRVCYEVGLKMYSLSKDHYAYVRYPVQNHHHSDAKEPHLRRKSLFAGNTPSIERFFQNKKQGSE
ncbi:glycosyltransferase family 2 protein [Neobacillus drentensis]|uniref:glycosyltransferase family 2 protein n=1 Tax=Neobacillus drentensis TaxID=220684 RepID=UPI002FFF0B4F